MPGEPLGQSSSSNTPQTSSNTIHPQPPELIQTDPGPEPLASMEQRIRMLRRRTKLLREEKQLLEEQAVTLQLLHGDDFTQYPEEVRAYLQ